jgi:hypothetical protein
MSTQFWKMMDRFFLVLIEITGEKDELPGSADNARYLHQK